MEKKKLVLIVNGSGRVGKTTLCGIVEENYSNTNFIVLNISSVDRVKQCAKLLGWNGISKNELDRKFLSDLKDLSTQYCDGPFKYEVLQIEGFYSLPFNGILFIHIREPQEIKKLVDKYPEIKTVLVKNKNVPKIVGNHADSNVENYQYDYYIDNNGTLEEYKETVLNFIDNLVKEGGYDGTN